MQKTGKQLDSIAGGQFFSWFMDVTTYPPTNHMSWYY